MADFYQNIVPTFTRLENEDLNEMEAVADQSRCSFPDWRDHSGAVQGSFFCGNEEHHSRALQHELYQPRLHQSGPRNS